jgi:hypothetical protein
LLAGWFDRYTPTPTVVDGKKDSFRIVIKKSEGSTFYNAPVKHACGGKVRILQMKQALKRWFYGPEKSFGLPS